MMKPHVVHPLADDFLKNLKDFAAICRVVNGMKRFNVGCIGSRTTAFKTTRFDEIALQKYKITKELSKQVGKVIGEEAGVTSGMKHLLAQRFLLLSTARHLFLMNHIRFKAQASIPFPTKTGF